MPVAFESTTMLRSSQPSLRVLGLAAVLAACSSPTPNRNPTGETFPSVQGTTLEGDPVRLPEDLGGAPAVLLIGYVQDTQFDIDRWFMGLVQADVQARVIEVPTIPGLVPSLLSDRIDDGMRSGIPAEAWSEVVTVYDDARSIVELTGSERPRNARVVLLDADGKVAWFHDRGYLPPPALELAQLATSLRTGTEDGNPTSDA